MLTNFKSIGKHVIYCIFSLKNSTWRAAWILALSHGIASAALPVAVGNASVPSLAPLLKQVTPAVVNISVLTKSAIEDNPLFRDPFFRRFFDAPEKREPQVSAGSGVIVDAAKGYVLTNNHVIKNAQQILVTLKDRRQLEAKLVGTDPGTDIALLKIDAKDLTAIPIGERTRSTRLVLTALPCSIISPSASPTMMSTSAASPRASRTGMAFSVVPIEGP